MRALLIGNDGDCDPGFIGAHFRERGFEFETWHREEHASWGSVAGADLVLLMGSEWSLYWEHLEAETAREVALVHEAAGAGIPIFGICYGSQMLAHALGGTVRRSEVVEIGFHEIDSDLPEHIDNGPWMEWHYDVFTVPPGATELARSAVCPQAFVRDRSFAVQFHPEVDRRIVASWIEAGGAAALERHGIDRDALLDRFDRETLHTDPSAGRLVEWFLNSVAGAVRD